MAVHEISSGGLVWREHRGTRTLAAIHRPRHADWTLPKGGVEPGESLEEASLREVREETGVDGAILGFAGVIEFEHDGCHEIAFFWHMHVRAEGAFVPSEEVDEVAWLTKEDALERLTHARERDLLKASRSPDDVGLANRTGQAWRDRWQRRWQSLVDPSADRLAAVRRVNELEYEEASRTDGSADWRRVLRAADDASARRMTEAAWLCVKLAQRLQFLGMNDEEIDVKAVALRAETATKLSGWRGVAVAELLSEALFADALHQDVLGTPDNRASSLECRRRLLYEGAKIRDEAADNEYWRLALLRRNRTVLLPVLAIAVTLLGVLVLTGAADLGTRPSGDNAGFLVAVATFGVLGATLSAIQSLGTGIGQRIPEAIASATLTLARPAVGAAAALGAFIIVQAGFVRLEATSGYVLLAFAFAAGFSERFIFRLVEPATKK